MEPQRLAAFSEGQTGGNPAGVLLTETLPDPSEMQRIAREIGYSETAFAAPLAEGGWRVRYFAPEIEVPFCGHATIALGAALARAHGAGLYELVLNDAGITVEADPAGDLWKATLASPPARVEPLEADLLAELLALFSLSEGDLDPRLRPMIGTTGPRHPVLALQDRARLAGMSYAFEIGRRLMEAQDLTTISLIHVESPRTIIARNPFAVGGVVEDPATGAAAAGLAAVLMAQGWDGLDQGGAFTIRQGEDMGVPSRLEVAATGVLGDPVRVTGTVRAIRAGEAPAP